MEQHSFAISAEMTRDDTTANGLIVGNIIPSNKRSSNFISVNIVRKMSDFTWKLPELQKLYKGSQGFARSPSSAPSPTVPRLSNPAADCRVVEGWGCKGRVRVKQKQKKRNCSVLRRDSFLNSFKNILKTVNYVM